MSPNVTASVDGENLLGPALDTLPSNIAILDTDGWILATNDSWQAFAHDNNHQMSPATIDVNYLEITEAAEDKYADRAATGLRAVLQGEREQFELEYPCHSPAERCWFLLRAAGFTHKGNRYAAVAHVDITNRRERERALRTAYEISASDRSFSQKVDSLLELGREVLGTAFGTLSHVQGEEYTFEAVATPDDTDLAEGDTVPIETLPNCERVVETEETLVLRDVASEAPDLLDAEWGITSYLGAPVVVDDEVHGTFCFYSMETRTEAFSEWEVTFVELLSAWVSTTLERRHYTDLLTALDTAFPDLAFLIDADGMYLDYIANREMADRLVGEPDQITGQTLHDVLPAGTADTLLATVREAIDTSQRQTVEYELDVPAGTRWFEACAAPFAQGVYGPDTVVLIARDVTERKQREQKYRRLTERISDAYYAFDSEWTVTYWNESAADRSGISAAEIIGENFWDVFPELKNTRYEDTLQEALASQEHRSCEYYYEEGDYWVDVQIYPDDEGISVISQDITERKEHEQELEHQRDELTQLNRLNTLAREIIQALQDTTSREAIETAVCERLTESSLYQGAWIGIRGSTATGDQTVIPQTSTGIGTSYLEEMPAMEGPARKAIETGAVQVINDIATADRFSESHQEQALDQGHQALAAVPLVTGGAIYGVLVVYPHGDQIINDSEQTVLADLGQMIAQALQRVLSQQALSSEAVIALDLQIPNTDLVLGEVTTKFECELLLEQWVSTTDDGAIYYLSVHDADPQDVCAFLRETPLEWDCDVVREASDDHLPLIELHFDTKPSLPSDILANYGGSMTTARFEDGDLSLGVELPPAVDVRTIVDAFREVVSSVNLISKRYVDRPMETGVILRNQIRDQLTPKQEAALEAAYARGYYEWPRDSTVAELAESFDISGPTLHYRLRHAHKTLVTAVVDGPQTQDDT